MKSLYYYSDGTMKDKYYYKDGTTSTTLDVYRPLHREDGPAIERANGDKFWYIDNKLHRSDGPAVTRKGVDGPQVKYFWIDNEHYSEKDFNKLITRIKRLPLAMRLTDPREWVRKL